jgi:hypothetical protein
LIDLDRSKCSNPMYMDFNLHIMHILLILKKLVILKELNYNKHPVVRKLLVLISNIFHLNKLRKTKRMNLLRIYKQH